MIYDQFPFSYVVVTDNRRFSGHEYKLKYWNEPAGNDQQ